MMQLYAGVLMRSPHHACRRAGAHEANCSGNGVCDEARKRQGRQKCQALALIVTG